MKYESCEVIKIKPTFLIHFQKKTQNYQLFVIYKFLKLVRWFPFNYQSLFEIEKLKRQNRFQSLADEEEMCDTKMSQQLVFVHRFSGETQRSG